MTVSHVPIDLSLGGESGNRVDDDHIHSTTAYEGFTDFKGLFATVRLTDPKLVNINSKLLRICGIQGMLSIDECGDSSGFLAFCDGMQGQGSLSAAFRSVNLYDTATGISSYPQSLVKQQGA